jgi:Ca-activated chloride channel family protein
MTYNPEDPRLTMYALGEMPEDEQAEFEAGLDAEARAEIEAIRETANLLALELATEGTPSLTDSQRTRIEVAAALPRPGARRFHWVMWAAAAACFVALVSVMTWPAVRERMALAKQLAERDQAAQAAPGPAEDGSFTDSDGLGDEAVETEAAAKAVRSRGAPASLDQPIPGIEKVPEATAKRISQLIAQGDALRKAGREPEAKERYELALKLDPYDVTAFHKLREVNAGPTAVAKRPVEDTAMKATGGDLLVARSAPVTTPAKPEAAVRVLAGPSGTVGPSAPRAPEPAAAQAPITVAKADGKDMGDFSYKGNEGAKQTAAVGGMGADGNVGAGMGGTMPEALTPATKPAARHVGGLLAGGGARTNDDVVADAVKIQATPWTGDKAVFDGFVVADREGAPDLPAKVRLEGTGENTAPATEPPRPNAPAEKPAERAIRARARVGANVVEPEPAVLSESEKVRPADATASPEKPQEGRMGHDVKVGLVFSNYHDPAEQTVDGLTLKGDLRLQADSNKEAPRRFPSSWTEPEAAAGWRRGDTKAGYVPSIPEFANGYGAPGQAPVLGEKPLVGRYAFTVIDESGRIDANEAKKAERFNREAYDRVTDNPFKLVRQDPLSTFSIDVDTASYANVRRFITQHTLPPPDAVRIEELVNYFSYDYEEPKGERPFSVSADLAQCPWAPKHRLVRVALKGREVDLANRPTSNLVFLLDVSGSMNEPNKLPLVKKSMRMLVENLGENDRVAIVVYAGASGMVLPSTTCDQKETVLAALDRLQAGGSTNGGAGIQLAYQTAVANFIKGGTNRVILATDGDFNVGISDRGQLTRLIEEKARTGVFLTVLGYGNGNLQDALLEQISGKGNGTYAYIDSLREARKVMVEQIGGTLLTIAKDVKIQVEFNPARIGAYRLLGYENRILQHQDFNDDTKDAGEIGAGLTVTAFYELVPRGVQIDVPGVDPLKYQTVAMADEAVSEEAMTVKLRYKLPDGDTSTLIEQAVKDEPRSMKDMSDDYVFATSVAAFGMILRDSPYKGSCNLALVEELAQTGARRDPHGYRKEFLGLVELAKGLKK